MSNSKLTTRRAGLFTFKPVKKVIDTLATEGPWGVLKRVRHRVSERYHEWRLGLASSGFVHIADLYNDTTCFSYEPTDYRSLKKVFKNLQLRPGEDVFIDYGSGMGRVAIVAATYPFRRVIGVELSPELNSIADANLRRVKSKLKCQDVQFIAIDARSYILHPDVTIIYCFSPFGEEVISKIVDNIHRSLTNNPRKLTIVYCNPRIYEKVISNCDWLIKRWEFQRWDNIRFVAYESRPEAFQPPVTPT